MNASQTHVEANLLSRLDRLPLTRSVVGMIAILAFVWVIEAFDIGIIGQVILVLKKLWTLSPGDVGLLGISSTIGIVIGVYSAGFLVDRFGRKRVLIWGVTLFTLFTMVGALVPNLTWIVVMRFLGGLGEGAVFPLPYLMISELVGAKHRGKLVSYANAVLCAAYVLPSLIGFWAIEAFPLEMAWRIPFIVGGIPVLSVILIAKLIPESPRWLMRQGRSGEVRVLVERLEREAGMAHDESFLNPGILKSLQTAPSRKSIRVADLLRPPFLSRSLISWGLYTGTMIFWYAMLVYAPSIFAQKGFNLGSAVMFTGAMMVIGGAGECLIGHLSDTYGRKPVYLAFSVLAAAGCVVLAQVNTLSLLIAGGVVAAFFGFGTLPAAKIYIAEQYPTELRGTGSGVGEAVSRLLGGVLATYYISFILEAGGVSAVFWFVGAAFIVLVIPMMVWGQETAGKSVEETGSTEKAGQSVAAEATGLPKVARPGTASE